MAGAVLRMTVLWMASKQATKLATKRAVLRMTVLW
jgi:hypothetical protein